MGKVIKFIRYLFRRHLRSNTAKLISLASHMQEFFQLAHPNYVFTGSGEQLKFVRYANTSRAVDVALLRIDNDRLVAGLVINHQHDTAGFGWEIKECLESLGYLVYTGRRAKLFLKEGK